MSQQNSGDLLVRRFERLRGGYHGGRLTRHELAKECQSLVYEAAWSVSGTDGFLDRVGSHDVFTDCLLVLAAERTAITTTPRGGQVL